jgi:hypothetical protein
MSRPRFLADNDLMDQIVLGVLRREPTLVMTRLREVELAKAPTQSCWSTRRAKDSSLSRTTSTP